MSFVGTPARHQPQDHPAATPVTDFTAIEDQKENIQPLSIGRSAYAMVTQFAAKKKQVEMEMKEAKDAFEAELAEVEERRRKEAEEGDRLGSLLGMLPADPLSVYERYIARLRTLDPSGKNNASILVPLLERCTSSLVAEDMFHQEKRYLDIWICYASLVERQHDVFEFMLDREIGTDWARLYEIYAEVLEAMGRYSQAESVLQLGLARRVKPLQHLKTRYEAFKIRSKDYQARLPSTQLPSIPTPSAPALSRSAFGSISAFPTPGVLSGGGGSVRENGKKSSVTIFIDDGKEDIEGQKARWNGDLATRDAGRKENERESTPWNEAGPLPIKGKKLGKTLEIEIFRDEDSITPAAPHHAPDDIFSAHPRSNSLPEWKVLAKDPLRNMRSIPAPTSSRYLDPFSLSIPHPQPKSSSRFQPSVASNPLGFITQLTKWEVPDSKPPLNKAGKPEIRKFRWEEVYRDEREWTFEDIRARRMGLLGLGRDFWIDKVQKESPPAVPLVDPPTSPSSSLILSTVPSPVPLSLHSPIRSAFPVDTFSSTFPPALSPAPSLISLSLKATRMGFPAFDSSPLPSSLPSPSTPSSFVASEEFALGSKPSSLFISECATSSTSPSFEVSASSTFEPLSTSTVERSSVEYTSTLKAEPEPLVDVVPQLLLIPKHESEPFVPSTPPPPPAPRATYENRSGPSPTINTKAAMEDVMSMFNAGNTTDEDEDEDEDEDDYSDGENSDDEPPITMIPEPQLQSESVFFSPIPVQGHLFDIVEEEDEGEGDRLPRVFREEQPVEDDFLGLSLEPSSISITSGPSSTVSHPVFTAFPDFPNPCNPIDDEVMANLMLVAQPPLSSLLGYHDLSTTSIDQLDRFQKIAKQRARRGSIGSNKTGAERDGSAFGLVTLDQDLFEVKDKIGEGGYGAVFIAQVVQPSFLIDIGNEEEAHGYPRMVALKVEKPASIWEGLVLDRVRTRIAPHLRSSIISSRGLYVFQDESYLVLDYSSQGTLLDAVNNAAALGVAPSIVGGPAGMDELLVVFFAVELLRLVEGLHRVDFIHGDLKIDNCMVRLDDVPGGPNAWASQYDSEGGGGWSSKGVRMIDFGRAIDTSLFPPGQTFVAEWQVDQRDCVEMREARPWTFQTDYHGLASIFYCMLFGRYIETTAVPAENGMKRYKVATPFKRYWQTDIWTRLFDLLLNPKLHSPKLPIVEELAVIRGEMAQWLGERCNKDGKSLKASLRKLESVNK